MEKNSLEELLEQLKEENDNLEELKDFNMKLIY